MPNTLEYPLHLSLNYGLIIVCTHLCNRIFSVFCANSGKVIQRILVFLKSGIIQTNYTLQKSTYPQKHVRYSNKVLKSSLHITKSIQEQAKAALKYSPSLLFTMISELFRAVSLLFLMP